jgi:uncharacterized protein YigE (DUF2233 family)
MLASSPFRNSLRSSTLRALSICLLTAATSCGLRATDPAPPGLQTVAFKGQSYLIRTVNPRTEDLRLYWQDDQGAGLRDFAALNKYVSSHGGQLLFAANAGMFDPAAKPVGLFVQDSVEKVPLNLAEGYGNFCMKPNGVFLINSKHEARIVESSGYPAELSPAVWATQSGPLMLQRGTIHPAFISDSKNKKLRSGVGVRKDGTVVFAISRGPVNFYDFALLFLNELKCPNALYLDGEISAFYVPGMNDPMPHSFGPMFGLVKKTN